MKPNKKNFCGGNFQDWLEVNLTCKCNARCSWCIEKNGWHPAEEVSWLELVKAAMGTGKQNVILLGGEPTLYPHIGDIVSALYDQGRSVWVTTNGSMLTESFVARNLRYVTGVNISIHSASMLRNQEITGVVIPDLKKATDTLHEAGASVRFNCNCIAGHVDSAKAIENYVLWAKGMGANKVRFAELKEDDRAFVDLAQVLNYKYGLNDNPFTRGCNSDAVIHGVPVNFRQMCGLYTSRRTTPMDPEQEHKQVLYYDGKLYDGWQISDPKGADMEDRELAKLLRAVEEGKVTSEEAFAQIKGAKEKVVVKEVYSGGASGGGCCY